MLTLVEASRRIQWDVFTVQNDYLVNFNVNKGIAILSGSMIDVILNYKTWRGTRYLEDGVYKIGYGIGDPDDEQGLTEEDAYSEWVGYLRTAQRNVRTQLPIVGIPQATYDALVSLYIDTGTWRRVEANEGVYDVADAVRNGNWLLVADMISRGRINPDLRRQEARVAQLADYSFTKTRDLQRVQGVQAIRKAYVNGIANQFDRKQAEFVYYRQLGLFLPGMSDVRQRRIVTQART